MYLCVKDLFKAFGNRLWLNLDKFGLNLATKTSNPKQLPNKNVAPSLI